MKKRDLTKLALMGIAIGLCGGQIQADDFCDEMYVANTGCGGAPSPTAYPQQYQQQPINSSKPLPTQPQPQLMPQQQPQQQQQQPQQRPMGQGKQMTQQGGYLVSEAPPMPEDHPASQKSNIPPPQKVPAQPQGQGQQSNNARYQTRPTADANNYQGNAPSASTQQRPYPNQNPNSTNR